MTSLAGVGPRVLVVDDDRDLLEMLRRRLAAEGMRVAVAADGADTLVALGRDEPDLVLLDLDLPDLDGLDVLAAVRRHSDVPVIILSGRRHESDRVGGLEHGADDYVVKPFSPKELVARIRTVLRRRQPLEPEEPARPESLVRGDLVVDGASRTVTRAGVEIDLARREFELLRFLAANPGRVFTREELLAAVWGSSAGDLVPTTVTEHVRRLRDKLGDPGGRLLRTVRGVGYRFG